MEFNKPLRVNDSIQLEDAKGAILTTPLVWRTDIDHIRRQRALAQYLCDLVNMEFNKPLRVADQGLTSNHNADKIPKKVKK